MVYGAVVGERVADPVTARVTVSKIAISVIDPTIDADGRTPMSWMKDEYSAGLAPVSRSPENAYAGWPFPTAEDPDVSFIAPVPVPRRP